MTHSDIIFEVKGLQVFYGGIAAVKGIDIEIGRGEMVCLIGANGAGKTTTLKALVRMIPSRGTIRYDGEDISSLPIHSLISRGITMVPEGRGMFPRLTVAENLAMGAYHRKDKKGVEHDIEYIYDLLPRLRERLRQVAGTLSGGEQQMLAIGRALMGRPRLLLLDEPSMGLAPLMVEKVFEVVKKIAAEGVTILLVEQNAKIALSIASRGYVMEGGLITLTDEARSLLDNPQVRAAYLGE